jgi:hypothetical protein
MKNAEARSAKQLVRWGAKCRDKTINEKIPGGETIVIETNDMKANILCYAESDENFPETYTQKKNSVMAVFQDSAKNPQMQEIMFNAANIEYLQSVIGIKELYIPIVASYKKQLGEIEVMLNGQGPVPNPQYQEAEAKILMLKQQGVPAEVLEQAAMEAQQIPPELCSLPIDAQVDDNDTEAASCWKFINDESGRKLKRANSKAYEDIRLHFLAHVDAAKAKAASQQATGKPPSTSINYKDVVATDAGAAQGMLKEAGLTPSPTAGTPAPVPAPAGAKAPAAPLPVGNTEAAGGPPKR